MVGIKDHTIVLDPQRESIKLTKTTRSYTWEIKIIPVEDKLGITKLDINRIQEIDNWLKEKFTTNEDYL